MPRILGDLRSIFESCSVSAFLVGGTLRDALLGRQTCDIDAAIQVEDPMPLARELARRLGGAFVPLGHEHHVARVVVDSPDYGRWSVDLSGIQGSLHDDLLRRDFTIDALALPFDRWDRSDWPDCIIDPTGGRADLGSHVIRAVGPQVFRDDPVRLLRAVRLSAQLDFRIDPETLELMRPDSRLVANLAGERIRNELLAILASERAKEHLRTMDDLGLLCAIIPELQAAKGVSQPREHYWDVFDHSIETVGAVERVLSPGTRNSGSDTLAGLVPWSPEIDEHFAEEVSDGYTRATMLKMGALLHDVAKPQTKMVDPKGKTRFLGHHSIGAEVCRDIAGRLRVSNRGTDMLAALVDNHLRPTQMSQGGEMPTHRAIYRYFRDVGDAAIDTLYLSLADHLAARGPTITMDGWKEHIDITEHILNVGTREQSRENMPRLITGHDVMRKLGLQPGPLVGRILEEVRGAQASGTVSDADGALVLAQSLAAESPVGDVTETPAGGQDA